MDYDNPQFISAVKKVLRDALAQLTDSLNNLKNAVTTHWQADEKRYQTKPVAISDLRTEVPIQVQTEPKRGKPEKVWLFIIGTLEGAAFIAIIGYTFVAYQQWKELIAAADASNKQANYARRAFFEAHEDFRSDQRPWVGVISIEGSTKPGDSTGQHFGVKLKLMNSGKTPAFNIRAASQTSCQPLGQPEPKPTYTERDVGKDRSTQWPSQELWIDNDKAIFCNATNMQLLRVGKATIYVLGTIWYEDQFRHPHGTEFCFFVIIPEEERGKLGTPGSIINGKHSACRHHNNAY